MGFHANHGKLNERANGNEMKTGSIKGMMGLHISHMKNRHKFLQEI